MEAADRHLSFYVALTGMTSLDDATKGERRVLGEELISLFFPWLKSEQGVEEFLTTVNTAVFESLRPSSEHIRGNAANMLARREEIREHLLDYCHEIVARYLRPILQGRRISIMAGRVDVSNERSLQIDLQYVGGSRAEHWEFLHEPTRGPFQNMRATLDNALFDLICDESAVRSLGVCPVCATAFIRQRMGHPQKYCGPQCRAKGIPSAAKRTTYTRNQRRKVKERESRIVREILDKTPGEAERIGLLIAAFPRKSLQQQRNLVKRVERIEHPIKEV
jgi:hypothetical protein